MKLNAKEGRSYFANPDLKRCGLLIYGPDAMRIALRRQEVIEALVGDKGDEEMRLTRIPASELRKDPAQSKLKAFSPVRVLLLLRTRMTD
jgi:DNA polymerase-3 subunit delta